MKDIEVNLVEKENVPSEAKLPTKFGDFKIRVFHEQGDWFRPRCFDDGRYEWT